MKEDITYKLIRVLKKNGTALISFWSFENQDKFAFNVGDNMVKWKHSLTNITYDRFYYIFNEEMLKKFIDGFIDEFTIKILEIVNEKGNWYIKIRKG